MDKSYLFAFCPGISDMIYAYISQVLTVEKAMRVLSDDTKLWDRLYGEYGFRPQYPELTDPRSIAKMLISNPKM